MQMAATGTGGDGAVPLMAPAFTHQPRSALVFPLQQQFTKPQSVHYRHLVPPCDSRVDTLLVNTDGEDAADGHNGARSYQETVILDEALPRDQNHDLLRRKVIRRRDTQEQFDGLPVSSFLSSDDLTDSDEDDDVEDFEDFMEEVDDDDDCALSDGLDVDEEVDYATYGRGMSRKRANRLWPNVDSQMLMNYGELVDIGSNI